MPATRSKEAPRHVVVKRDASSRPGIPVFSSSWNTLLQPVKQEKDVLRPLLLLQEVQKGGPKKHRWCEAGVDILLAVQNEDTILLRVGRRDLWTIGIHAQDAVTTTAPTVSALKDASIQTTATTAVLDLTTPERSRNSPARTKTPVQIAAGPVEQPQEMSSSTRSKVQTDPAAPSDPPTALPIASCSGWTVEDFKSFCLTSPLVDDVPSSGH
ncbi:unnamed protein product [Jaminaea pallidilutea]